MRTPWILASALLAACTLPAADVLPSQVDRIFEKYDRQNSPGCALGVYQDGRIVYKRAYGMADLDHEIALTAASVFHVASMSKQFTAASIVMLANEGKLSLDDEVRKYIPELPDFGVPIYIRHLIHHTSGLRDQWTLLGLAGWRYSLDLITDQDVLDLVSRQKALNFKPGDKHLYCNTGYTLLAQVVARVSGKSFRKFTTERIFEPLGMKSTHFRDDHAEIVKNMAYGYAPNDRDSFSLSVTNFDTVGATSLLTTVEDLIRWDENFYQPRVGGPALIKQMLQKGKLNSGEELIYAFGLQVSKYRELPTVDHSGSDAGYKSDLIRFPEQHFSVSCLCNLATTVPSQLTRRVADQYLADRLKGPVPEPPKPPERPKGNLHLTAGELAAYAGTYRSDEIEPPYSLVVEGNALMLKRLKSKPEELRPFEKDGFRIRQGTVHFQRDAQNRVTSLSFDMGRVLDFKMRKVAN